MVTHGAISQMKQTNKRSTGVYHDGEEVAVRLNSQTSRTYHDPKTDADGNVVFDDDGYPLPACGKVSPVGKDWLLRAVERTGRSDKCRNCSDDDDKRSERNAKGSGNITLGRLAQKSDFKGAESLSANASHSP